MTADTEEIRRALSLLFSNGTVVELRALGDGGVHSGYFTDFDVMADRAAAIDNYNDVHGVYVTLNEVNPVLLSRRANRIKQRLSRTDTTTADKDIVRRRWFPIDLDPVRPSGVSASEEEHIAALKRAEEITRWLTGKGFPAPVTADSGNGAHLLYAIDLPNDDEATKLVKACLAVLDAFFSDETVHCDTANFNAARIWKCYGTTACKGDNTTERPHRMARIITAPKEPEVVPNDMLRDLADCIPRSAPKVDKGRRRGSFDLRWWLDHNTIAVKTERPWQGGTLFSLAECPFSTAHTDGAFAIQFANGALFAGCHHDSCGGGTQRWQEFRGMYEPERIGGKKRSGTKGTDTSTNEEVTTDDPSPVSPIPDTAVDAEEHRKRAMEILETGDPLAFLLDVFHREHVGDQTVAECLAMSVASQSVENTAGLHVSISGNSGKGKTHACNAMGHLLPEEYRIKGTLSDKALFYDDDLRPGTVLLFDDIGLSDDMQELLKSATANFREPIVHRTLTRERQLKVCTIPERCVWWLAKVESIGDDQVMNRMLTVWIDDSAAQDRAVLDHLKKSETGVLCSATDDTDVYVCRAMWEILKSAVRRVKIPFAERISFSTIQNRRNPAMLFDLIKCHALLHFFQRETDADGTLIATHDDFAYARKLFTAINGDGGGQETKLTKNEAAALQSIAKMNLEVFTIHQLQDALGFSYQPTYRLLHGYTTKRATYAGILDKCPAVSFIDATVAEMLSGMEIKRREKYFSFDVAIYRDWMRQSDVWLEPDDTDGNSDDDNRDDGDDRGDDVFIFSSRFRTEKAKNEKINGGDTDVHSSKRDSSIDICTDSTGCFHTNPVSFDNPVSPVSGSGCVSDIGGDENEPDKTAYSQAIPEKTMHLHLFGCKSNCKEMKTVEKMKTRQAGTTPPLPGILDHRDFEHSPVSLGHCTLCGDGRAVYQSKAQRAAICEKCYARLVREWNKSEGVV